MRFIARSESDAASSTRASSIGLLDLGLQRGRVESLGQIVFGIAPDGWPVAALPAWAGLRLVREEFERFVAHGNRPFRAGRLPRRILTI
jgi:hypothetical protein